MIPSQPKLLIGPAIHFGEQVRRGSIAKARRCGACVSYRLAKRGQRTRHGKQVLSFTVNIKRIRCEEAIR